MRVTSLQLEALQLGMVYEMHHDGLSHAVGHGVYGGLNDRGEHQWWVEGYSLREYNERTPPTIDWKRTPMCNYIPQRHAFLSLEPVSDFESYVKNKMPKGVRKFFETLLQAPTFSVAPAEKYVCTSCNKVYIYKTALDKHIESGVCMKPEESDQHVCNACGKRYVRKGDLENHVLSGVCSSPSNNRSASLSSAPKKAYHCPHCKISLRSQAAMDIHVPLCELKNVGRIPAVISESTAPFPRYAAVTYPTQFPPLILEDLNEWARGQEPPDIDAHEKHDSEGEGQVKTDQLDGLNPMSLRKKRTVSGEHICKHCGQKFKVLGWFSKHEAACEGEVKRNSELASTYQNEEAAIKPAQEPVVCSKATSTMKGPPEDQGVQRKDSKPMELPNSVQRVVSRFWNPLDAEKGFTWSELESIGNKILGGTTFLRMHYKMRPGVQCTTELESMTVADGAMYVRAGEMWVHYPDPEFRTREHLDVTADCCILMVEELKSSIWGV